MSRTQVSLNAQRKAAEKKYWDQRAARWVREEDDRQQRYAIEGSRRRTKWAIDHLYEQDKITLDQHGAASRLGLVVAVAAAPPLVGAANVVPIHAAWDLTLAAELRRIASVCGPAEARDQANDARSWVASSPLATPKRMRLYDAMFALPCRSWRAITGGHDVRDDMTGQACAIFDSLIAFWATVPELPFGAVR